MSLNTSATHVTVRETLKQLNFPQIVKQKMKERNQKLSVFSQQIGRDGSYFSRRINDYDQPVSVILLLSLALEANLLEPFSNLLPASIPVTEKEKELQLKIASLEKQLEELGKERDIYKNIVLQTR